MISEPGCDNLSLLHAVGGDRGRSMTKHGMTKGREASSCGVAFAFLLFSLHPVRKVNNNNNIDNKTARFCVCDLSSLSWSPPFIPHHFPPRVVFNAGFLETTLHPAQRHLPPKFIMRYPPRTTGSTVSSDSIKTDNVVNLVIAGTKQQPFSRQLPHCRAAPRTWAEAFTSQHLMT
jgi:hypothetical protein